MFGGGKLAQSLTFNPIRSPSLGQAECHRRAQYRPPLNPHVSTRCLILCPSYPATSLVGSDEYSFSLPVAFPKTASPGVTQCAYCSCPWWCSCPLLLLAKWPPRMAVGMCLLSCARQAGKKVRKNKTKANKPASRNSDLIPKLWPAGRKIGLPRCSFGSAKRPLFPSLTLIIAIVVTIR